MADATSLNVVKFATPRVPIASLSSPWPPWSQFSKCSPTFSLSFSLLFRVVTGERQHHCELCIPHARFARLSLAQLSLINLFERAIVRSIAAHPIGGSVDGEPRLLLRGAAMVSAWTGFVCFSLRPFYARFHVSLSRRWFVPEPFFSPPPFFVQGTPLRNTRPRSRYHIDGE